MPKRINADVDMSILRDIGMGMKSKDIAESYDVSASYVSKLKTGKKVPDVYIPTRDDDILPGAVTFLKQRIKKCREDLLIYTEILNKYEGEDE